MLKKIISVACLLFSLLFVFLISLSERASANIKPLETLAPKSELTLVPTDSQVSTFLEKNKDYPLNGDFVLNHDQCYNITPDFIADNSDYTIFKYYKSCTSFIMYDGNVYRVYDGIGRIISMALADLNNDGEYELYYTCDVGSGIMYDMVMYFDPISKNREGLYYTERRIMLTADESGNLLVNLANIDYNKYPYPSVDYTITAKKTIGTIAFDGKKPVFIDN